MSARMCKMNNNRIVGAKNFLPLHESARQNRRSIRLRGHDYSRAGAYFVTVCVQNRECLFGHIVGAAPCGRPQMVLNDAGIMIQTVWDEIPPHYPGIEIDTFVVMPNHIHGIIVIVGAGPRACPNGRVGGAVGHGHMHTPDCAPTVYTERGNGRPRGAAPTLSLPDVVHRFKTLTTKHYADGVKQHGWPTFPGRLWQRNYYEHIIRNDDELNRIREYIVNNPAQWELDRENPVGARHATQSMTEWETT